MVRQTTSGETRSERKSKILEASEIKELARMGGSLLMPKKPEETPADRRGGWEFQCAMRARLAREYPEQ